MPIYPVKCAEGSRDCYGTVDVFIPYKDLSEEQLAAINEGEYLDVFPHNIVDMSSLSPEDAQSLQEDGSFCDTRYYRRVCAGCGSESSPGPNGTRIYD